MMKFQHALSGGSGQRVVFVFVSESEADKLQLKDLTSHCRSLVDIAGSSTGLCVVAEWDVGGLYVLVVCLTSKQPKVVLTDIEANDLRGQISCQLTSKD